MQTTTVVAMAGALAVAAMAGLAAASGWGIRTRPNRRAIVLMAVSWGLARLFAGILGGALADLVAQAFGARTSGLPGVTFLAGAFVGQYLGFILGQVVLRGVEARLGVTPSPINWRVL